MISEKIMENIITNRRNLHQIPELGLEEFKTQAYLKEKLIELGFQPMEICRTGLLVFIEGLKNETYAFRADIDALPIEEETGLEFTSLHKGKMHACGHDGHMTILLAFAEYLSEYIKTKKLEKNVLLIFQPAEEGPGGAKLIVQEGIFDKYNVKGIFGLHLFPNIEEGVIACKAGAMMAQTGEIDIEIKGRSGHGAMPHTSIDTILISAKLLEAYQSIISRNINPMDNAVLTFGKITGGTVRNIIAETIRLEGTARTFSRENFDFLMDRLCQINRGFELAFDVKINEDIRPLYPAVINSKDLYNRFLKAIDGMNYKEIEALMLAEDFAFYQETIPGLFFFLGTRNNDMGFNKGLHNCAFNFDEKVLLKGLEVYIRLLTEYEI